MSFQLLSMTTGPAGLRCVQAYRLFSPIGDTNVSEDASTLSTSHWYSRASWSGSRRRWQPPASSGRPWAYADALALAWRPRAASTVATHATYPARPTRTHCGLLALSSPAKTSESNRTPIATIAIVPKRTWLPAVG